MNNLTADLIGAILGPLSKFSSAYCASIAPVSEQEQPAKEDSPGELETVCLTSEPVSPTVSKPAEVNPFGGFKRQAVEKKTTSSKNYKLKRGDGHA